MHFRLMVILLALFFVAVQAQAAEAERIAPGVFLLRGTFVPGKQPDGNTVLFTSRRGLLVIDTGRHAAHTQSILDFAKERRMPVGAVINTHWHLDHIGGNLLLRRAYPELTIYASNAFHEATSGFLANYRKQLESLMAGQSSDEEKKTYQIDLSLLQNAAELGPTQVITASGRRSIAGRRLEVHLEDEAVTAGDLWLLDRASGVLVAGDLVTLPAPFLDTACPRGWSEALDRVAAAKFRSLVPGHGPVMDRAAFNRYRSAFSSLLRCAESSAAADLCIDGWTEALSPWIGSADPKWVRSMMEYYVSLLRNKSHSAKYCS